MCRVLTSHDPSIAAPVNPQGLAVLLAVLVAATAFGVYRRRVDGRMRATMPVAGIDPATVLDPTLSSDGSRDAAERLTGDELGAALGPRATLVQFSSAFCAPCRAARRLLSDVADSVEGVAYVDVDAESHLDLVRTHGVLRTPTVLVLDAHGRVVRRAVGLPRKPEVIAALGEAIP